ncbi:MAG: Tol-Pal system beta propeller repeat protein TolB [Desulfobacteraceae bacterium]|nr:Tol-Pal system beta propeller repeat protein TolB [Desulfobacteraceae bacterium]
MIYKKLIQFFSFFVVALTIIIVGNGIVYCQDVTILNINNPSIRKIPLAIPGFKQFLKGESIELDAKDAQKLLMDAFNFTGYLKIIDERAYLADPSETGIAKKDIDFLDWTGIGAELLITGGISVDNDKVKLWLRLFDTFDMRLLVGKIYTGERKNLREMIHRFCGEVSQKLTGKRGIFGSKIAFVSKVNGKKEIFSCEFDGFNPEQITFHNSISLSPAWSSDSEWIAYSSYAKKKPDIYIKNLKEKRGSIINKKGMNIAPAWVPGQFALAASLSFSGDPEIYLLTGKGKIIKRLTNSWGIDISPKFSPDGRKIVFVSRRRGSPQIFIKNLDTNQIRRLTFEGSYNTSPAWSPNGDRIAYVGIRDGRIDIHTIGIGGEFPVQLTNAAGDNEDPSWSPDGSLIVFSSTRQRGRSQLFVMTAAGGEQRRLLKLKGEQTDPDWSMVNN